MTPPPAKGAKIDVSLASGRHHYRVNTRGDQRRDGHANDRLVCSPYYPPHDGWVARIKGRCDNDVGLDGRQRRCAQQPEVQSKLDVLGGPPAMVAEAAVQVEHQLNLARSCETDRENGYENRLSVFSYERSPIRIVHYKHHICTKVDELQHHWQPSSSPAFSSSSATWTTLFPPWSLTSSFLLTHPA